MKIRRILSISAATAVLSTVALASPAVADDKPREDSNAPIMTSNQELGIERGKDAWVSIGVSSRTELQNVHIIVEENKKGTEVTYPGDGSSAGLSQGDDLLASGLDRARIKLSTSGESSDKFDLTVIAVWDEGGQTHRAEIGEIKVKLAEHDGDDYEFMSSEATVSSDVSNPDEFANWVDMTFLGIAPINSDFEIKIKKGLDVIYYPQEKYTSLHHDDRLDGGENDTARIWIDPATVESGDVYTIEIEVKYTNNQGKNSKQKHEMTITVD